MRFGTGSHSSLGNLDAEKGTLLPADPAFLPCRRATVPGISFFIRKGRWFYARSRRRVRPLFSFASSTSESGRLTPKQTISSLPKGTFRVQASQPRFVSHPTAEFLYTANRLHGQHYAFFSVGKTGALTFAGMRPGREAIIHAVSRLIPQATSLYSCNQRSDSIAAFRVDRVTGNLNTFTGNYIGVGTPAGRCIRAVIHSAPQVQRPVSNN